MLHDPVKGVDQGLFVEAIDRPWLVCGWRVIFPRNTEGAVSTILEYIRVGNRLHGCKQSPHPLCILVNVSRIQDVSSNKRSTNVMDTPPTVRGHEHTPSSPSGRRNRARCDCNDVPQHRRFVQVKRVHEVANTGIEQNIYEKGGSA